jgi:hypothetical protein
MKTATRFVVGAFTALLAVTAVGCSDSSDNTTKAAPSSTTPASAVQLGDARIVTFDVPATVECGGKTSTDVTVRYKFNGAKKMELLVDGRPYKLTDSSGEQQATVRCDSLPHTMVLVAYDSSNQRTAQQKLLTTNA